MIFTKHVIEQAKKRGISRDTLFLASRLNSECYSSEVAKGNYEKRIFFEINLLIAKRSGKISELESRKLQNLCLVVNEEDEEDEVLVTIYRTGTTN